MGTFNSFPDSEELAGLLPSISDTSFQTERAMWLAEFESVGEEAVRGYVERNSYTPTGMEVARQWLARREFLQLHGDVQSIRALVEQVQGTASESLRSASEALALAGRVDANSRAIVEIAANAKKTARTMVIVGIVTSLFALCAIVMVLASARQVAPNTKQASTQPSRPKQAVVRPPPPAVSPAETRQDPAIPQENTQKKQPPNKHLINSPDLKPEGQSRAITRQAPAIPPESARMAQASNAPQINSPDLKPEGQSRAITRQVPAIPPESARMAQASNAPQISSLDLKPEVQSLAVTRQAPVIPPESDQKEQPTNAPKISSLDLKPDGQSLEGALALIADNVGGEGVINFTAQFHEIATGRDYTEQLSYKASNVTIDPNRCQVGYQWHVERDGRAVSDLDRTVELRLAKSIRVTSIDDEPARRFFVRTYPKVYVVHIARWDNSSGDNLYFRDKDMAARVGRATRQAVELCNNGEQQGGR